MMSRLFSRRLFRAVICKKTIQIMLFITIYITNETSCCVVIFKEIERHFRRSYSTISRLKPVYSAPIEIF